MKTFIWLVILALAAFLGYQYYLKSISDEEKQVRQMEKEFRHASDLFVSAMRQAGETGLAAITDPELAAKKIKDIRGRLRELMVPRSSALLLAQADAARDSRVWSEAIALYRRLFRPRPGGPAAPHAAVAVAALCADSEAEAWRLWRPREIWRLGRDRGIYAPLPTVEEAHARVLTPAEAARIEALRPAALVGTPEQVAARIAALAAELQADEVAVLTPCPDSAARARSVRWLAEAWAALPQPALSPLPA